MYLILKDQNYMMIPWRLYPGLATAKLKLHGDDTPIAWIHRSERYTEKLATPDVTVADLIGDVDPIKAATLKLTYSMNGYCTSALSRVHTAVYL
jgi:hypothetical protein